MSAADVMRLNAIIAEDSAAKEERAENGDYDDVTECGLRIDPDTCSLEVAGESGAIDQLPEEFLVELGKLIGAAGEPYMQVEYAYEPPGGGECRIHPDGRIEYPILVYGATMAELNDANRKSKG